MGRRNADFLSWSAASIHTTPTLSKLLDLLVARGEKSHTNADTVPVEIWGLVRRRMADRGITQRQMCALRGTSYGGTSHFRFAPSRATLASYAHHLDDPNLATIATDDLYWDSVQAITRAGEDAVYDLEVPGPNCWVAGAGIVSHNSGQIEADADCVLMLYRDDYYDPDSERPGEMDIIVRKNRQGRLGQVTTRIDSRLRYLPVERET